MKTPLLFLLPFFACASLLRAAVPGALTAHLKEAAIVHVDFQQTRTLAALSRPLKASGRLVLARDRGVIWELKRPSSITYVMGPKGLMVVNAQGRKDRKSAREAPVVAQMGRIFSGLIQGDWRALEEYFSVQGEGTPSRWEVTMLPKPQAAAFLRKVQLSGGRFIDRIRLEEASGDRMEILFEHQRMDVPLSEAETRLLAQD